MSTSFIRKSRTKIPGQFGLLPPTNSNPNRPKFSTSRGGNFPQQPQFSTPPRRTNFPFQTMFPSTTPGLNIHFQPQFTTSRGTNFPVRPKFTSPGRGTKKNRGKDRRMTLRPNLKCFAKCPFCPTSYPKIWDSSGQNIIVPQSQIFTACGINYVYMSERFNFYDAFARCCTLGMKLWFVNNVNLQCLAEAINRVSSEELATPVWTSGVDTRCSLQDPRNFRWCADGTDFISTNYWSPGQPDFSSLQEKCITYDAQTLFSLKTYQNMSIIPGTGMATRRCHRRFNFICQASSTPPPRSTTVCGQQCVDCKSQFKSRDLSVYVPPINYMVFPSPCGSVYAMPVYPPFQLSYKEASIACCKLQMRLITFEYATKLDCFAKAYLNIANNKRKPVRAWTSARVITSCTSDKRYFDWLHNLQDEHKFEGLPWDYGRVLGYHMCGTSSVVDNNSWLRFLQQKEGQEQTDNDICISFVASRRNYLAGKYKQDKPVMQATDCTQKLFYFCESTTTTTPSPCYRKICPRRRCRNTFDNNSAVRQATEKASLEPLGSACGRIYVRSRTEVTYDDALMTCCQIGMQILSIETAEEKSCLANVTFALGINIPPKGEYYWSSARSKPGCEGSWQFCGSGLWVDPQQTRWDFLQPDNSNYSEYCSAYFVFNDIYMLDVRCSSKFSVVCEGPLPQVRTENLR